MSTILDQAVSLGVESTYGTSVAPTRSFEAQVDVATKKVEYLESKGMRAGIAAVRSDRRTIIDMGGEGSLEADILNKGFGLLLRGMFSTSAVAQQGGTSAYKQTFTETSDGPTTSYTVQALRADSGGTLRTFTYVGTSITGWEIGVETGQLLKVKANLDVRQEITTPSATATSYPTSTVPFDWTQAVATINGNASAVKSFALTADLGMHVDRRYLTGSALKSQPIRKSLPVYEGTIELDYADTTFYTMFTAGSVVPITLTCTGAQIASPYNYTFKITLPACQFTGETPKSSMDDLTQQSLPFVVLHDGSNAPITVEYTSIDTTP